MQVKTMAGWRASGSDLGKYLSVGDAVSADMVDYFLGVLPPACYRANLVQIGEPNSHVNGRATFATVCKPLGTCYWKYAGNCHRGECTEPRDGAR